MKRLILIVLLAGYSMFNAQCSMALAQENDEVGIWSELGIEKAITKKWDVGLDLEYRAQNRARFSAGLSTSYKPWKWLKLGIGYNLLYSQRPDKYKNKDEGSEDDEEWTGNDFIIREWSKDNDGDWTKGYNLTPEYWFPRHRFSVEATGSIKLWNCLKISVRERYQITHSKTRTVNKLKYRDKYYTEWQTHEDEITIDYTTIPWTITIPDPTEVFVKEHKEEWEQETKPAYTDQVLRSRIKFEYDKKRCPFSPFISAEFHNSVSVGDHLLLQKIRSSIGCGYKFRKHNEVSLSYIITFDIHDIDDTTNQIVRLHDRTHVINFAYKYSF